MVFGYELPELMAAMWPATSGRGASEMLIDEAAINEN